MAAPDGSITLPEKVSARSAKARKNTHDINGRVMFEQPSAAGLHALQLAQPVVSPYGLMLNLAGRSPDSRIAGPVSLPIPCWNSGLFDRSSALTVAGPCWIFTS